MRAALLPTTGDPFIMAYWLRNFATWRDEVDELIVLANAYTFRDMPFVRRQVEVAGGRLLVTPGPLGHGEAIRRLLQTTSADHVVLCEEDAFVRRPRAVSASFAAIEDNDTDVIGSPRGEEHVRVEWGGYDPTDTAEVAHNLWPAFLFARAADLRATSQQFGDRQWALGQMVEGLGPVTPEHCTLVGVAPDRIHLDTFAGTTFELRAAGLLVELVHHTRLYDLAASWKALADDPPPWFHVTGSSEMPHVLNGTRPEALPDYGQGGGQWVRRLAWWERIVNAVDAPGKAEYLDMLARFRLYAGIDPAEDWAALFDAYEEHGPYTPTMLKLARLLDLDRPFVEAEA